MHPLTPFRARKYRARQGIELLDDCAREIRGLVTVAADPEASHDARLAAACWRVEAAVEALTAGRAEPVHRPAESPAEPALAHLHGLERALADLAPPLRTPSGSRLVGARAATAHHGTPRANRPSHPALLV